MPDDASDPTIAIPGGSSTPPPPEGVASSVAAGLPDMSAASGVPTNASLLDDTPALDGYRIKELLGEGAMGKVWRAVQLGMNREVALKVIGSAAARNDNARRRFDREVKVTGLLQHPNIARIYDSGILEGKFFYAMELIDGLPLDEYAERHHPRTRDVLQLMRTVCLAIDHAHQQGIIHRDLKPSNILVDKSGEPHVLDFGLAKMRVATEDVPGISMEGDLAGTVAFMSPEQAAGTDKIDVQSDVYSLGVILYKLLTGQTPHRTDGSLIQVLRRIQNDEVIRPRIANPALDSELEALLLKALERKPSRRYANAGDVARDIDNYLQNNPLTARPATLGYFVRKRVSKHRVPIAIALSILLTLAGMAVYGVVKIARERTEVRKQRDYAQLQLAHSHVSQGSNRNTDKQFADARRHFEEAKRLYTIHGLTSHRAELGLWRANYEFAPPLSDIELDSEIVDLALLKDNRRALIGCADGTLRVFDLALSRESARLTGHAAGIAAIAVSSDNTVALSADATGAIRSWDLAALKPTGELSPATGNFVGRLAFSPSGRFAISTAADAFPLWDLTTRTSQFFGAKELIDIAFCSDNAAVALAGGGLSTIDLRTGNRQYAVDPPKGEFIAADGDLAAVSGAGGLVELWSLSTANHTRLTGLSNRLRAQDVAISNGRVLAVAQDLSACVWDATTPGPGEKERKPIRTFEPAGPRSARIASCALNDPLLLLAQGKRLRLHDTHATGLKRTIPLPGPTSDILLLDRDLIATLSGGHLLLFDAITARPLREPFPDAKFRSASAGGNRLLLLTADDTVRIVDTTTWKPIQDLSHPAPGRVACATLSADGHTALAVGRDFTIARWDLRTNKLTTHEDTKGTFRAIATNTDGSLALVGRADALLRLHAFGSATTDLPGHTASISALAISRSGALAASGSEGAPDATRSEGAVRLWDLKKRSAIRQLGDHSSTVTALAFSADDRLLLSASAGEDGEIKMYDIPLQTEGVRFDNPAPVTALAISADTTLIAAATSTGAEHALHLYDLAYHARRQSLWPQVAALSSKPTLSPADLAVLGQWHALHHRWDWAAELLLSAHAQGASIDPPLLVRALWVANRTAEARAASGALSPSFSTALSNTLTP